ncbi:MAG: FecR domain-containing protein [Pyrinomonadaceae bacterium]
MRKKHYKSKLSAFVNHELSKTGQQEIAEHLLQCTDCRLEYDRIKLGASLADCLVQTDAPDGVWNDIAFELDGHQSPKIAMIPQGSFFGNRNLAGLTIAILLVTCFAAAAYFTFFAPEKRPELTVNNRSVQNEQKPLSEAAVLPENIPANSETANSNSPEQTANGNSIVNSVPLPSFQFETISGSPTVGFASRPNELAVGDYLETNSTSQARIRIADIGNVEIRPNSRIKLVGTTPREHRLSLERGVLHAQISAPPRLFIVDTPSAVAVDLGCEYTLEVDKAGNSRLEVTSGFVALERDGRESIVPAGAVCLTRKGKGLGTPFSALTTDAFRSALNQFDFSGGGSRAVQSMLASSSSADTVSLWHLLSRVEKTDRAAVYDALSEYVKPPSEVTRDGILRLDRKMLSAWREEVESVWYE